jgi:hypothetical protein
MVGVRLFVGIDGGVDVGCGGGNMGSCFSRAPRRWGSAHFWGFPVEQQSRAGVVELEVVLMRWWVRI